MESSFKKLIVWQKSFELTLLVYKITKTFPKDETYGIVSQIRRAVLSIPSNIAEGYSRRRKLEFLHFLQIAYGSGAELETQILISTELLYLGKSDSEKIISLLLEVQKMLNSLIVKVKDQETN